MPTLKGIWNTTEKKEEPPMELEGDGTWFLFCLFYDRKEKAIPETLDISFGTCYCHSQNGNHVLFTLSPKAYATMCDHFLMEKDASGKWVPSAKLVADKEEMTELFRENKGRSVIYVNGHPGLETVVKHYAGKWIYLEGSILTKDTDLVTKVLIGNDTDTVDDTEFAKVSNGDIRVLNVLSDVPSVRRKGKLLPLLWDTETETEVHYKEIEGDATALSPTFIPYAVTKLNLPKAKVAGKSQGKSVREKWEESASFIFDKLGVTDFDALCALALEDPMKVRTVFALLGSGYGLSSEEYTQSAEVYVHRLANEETSEE